MRLLPGALLVLAMASTAMMSSCAATANVEADTETFPLGYKNLFPPNVVDNDLNLVPTEVREKNFRVAVGQPPAAVIQQPINYPHDRHVAILGMDCNYCHSGARKGIHAGIPPTQVCMGCHKLVSTEGRPELDKLAAFWADGKGDPIPWVKVHDLPDFVHFSHKRHVTAGLDCQECHGQVQDMVVNQRVATLQMGWCLDCHANHESIDRNYGVNAELRRAELKDCYTCHK